MMDGRKFIADYMPLREALYRIAYHILESEADAEDALQDLYVKLWNSRDALDGIGNPKGYCIVLLKNICIDRLRRKENGRSEPLPETLASGDDSSAGIERQETLSRVLRAMDRLSASQREVLRMKAVEGLSYEEMAERTGMNNLTLRVLLSQARKKIRKEL
jgi:RNA polymerase sigma-70 factor (ECF subfamily)